MGTRTAAVPGAVINAVAVRLGKDPSTIRRCIRSPERSSEGTRLATARELATMGYTLPTAAPTSSGSPEATEPHHGAPDAGDEGR